MYLEIVEIINSFDANNIKAERKAVLELLVQYIGNQYKNDASIRLNFICTHNSRRSHLSQIWAQTMAHYFILENIFCYSGGTEATALFPKVAETLTSQGFKMQKLSKDDNPVYAFKYAANENPIICFSKKYNDTFNPEKNFAAILTCNSADENCPVVLGADARFPIKYDDPKAFDNTELQAEKYAERSLQIAEEMWWVFTQIKENR